MLQTKRTPPPFTIYVVVKEGVQLSANLPRSAPYALRNQRLLGAPGATRPTRDELRAAFHELSQKAQELRRQYRGY
jgi:hypothetical protein